MVRHTFSEYLLVPGYSSAECIPANVSLKTPVVKYRRGEEPALTMNVPMVSAVMQAVSGEQMGIALAKEGGIAFIYVSQPIEQQAEMVRRVKNYKAGFVISDSNLRLGDTLADVLALKERTGHSTMAVTDDGTGTGKLLGLVTSRDYRVSRMDRATPVSEFMTPAEKIVSAPEGTSLKAANDIIWDHKLNALPIVSAGGHLVSFVFRKDYDSHKGNPLELLDSQKRYVVGAGINSRDYEERVPALVEAGARPRRSSMWRQSGTGILPRPASTCPSVPTAALSRTTTSPWPWPWARTSVCWGGISPGSTSPPPARC